MARRIEWDEHEQAVLLCALINVLEHKIERKQAIAEVSQQLRKRAFLHGITIDDKFRNENGISLQMAKLEYSFTNGKSGFHVDNGWYFSIVDTYRNDCKKYKKLLGGITEGSATNSDKIKMNFIEWINNKNPEKTRRIVAFLLILGNQRHCNIFKITNKEAIEYLIKKFHRKKGGRWRKYNAALTAYKDYLNYIQDDMDEGQNDEEITKEIHTTIKEKSKDVSRDENGHAVSGNSKSFNNDETFEGVGFTPYKTILTEKFPRGFRIDSRLDMGRLRNFWNEKFGSELTVDDEIVRRNIRNITIKCQDLVYLPEMLMSDQTAKRIFVYLDECFKTGKAAVYFDALYTEFKSEFVDKRINNPDMLKSYITFANNGRYYIRKTYLTADPDAEVNPSDEIRNYMTTIGVPISIDDLKESLSHINADTVYWTVAGSHSAEFVRNRKGEYFHADIIRFSGQEIDAITEMIQHSIDDKGYMGGKELTDTIAVKLPSVLERYPYLSRLGLRDVIAYKLRDNFSFKGKIISSYGQELSMRDVFAHFAATHDHFTLDQLNVLKRELDTPVYFDDVYLNSLRISQNDFVSRNQASFDIEATDTAIGRFCVGGYVPLKNISFFGSFPDAGFSWNEFLLEHYVAEFSKKFKLLHTGFNASRPGGAIVKRSSSYVDIEDVMVDELADSKIPLDREYALQYLVKIGLLARKNYGGIERVLSRAKIKRQRKG